MQGESAGFENSLYKIAENTRDLLSLIDIPFFPAILNMRKQFLLNITKRSESQMTDRELLDMILENQISVQNRIKSNHSDIVKRLDSLETNHSDIVKRLDSLETNHSDIVKRLDRLETNHSDIVKKLDRLETNQDAIKRFILNSDDTFKKSEEAYRVVQGFKDVLSK